MDSIILAHCNIKREQNIKYATSCPTNTEGIGGANQNNTAPGLSDVLQRSIVIERYMTLCRRQTLYSVLTVCVATI